MALTKIGATLGGSADVITVTQSSHGLYLGYPVKMTASGYVHATADTAANAEAVGIVIATDRTGANTTFSLALGGRITVDGCVPNLTAGTVLFLQVSAGLLAATEPSGNNQVSKPMAVITIANSEMVMVQQRGEVISTAGITLADDSVTLAKMAGGTDGQIITYDASGDTVAVGPGTAGQVLTSTGAGSPPAFENAAGGISAAQMMAYENASDVIGVTHPGSAKSWVSIASSGAREDPYYNVASVTDTGTGDRTVVFETDHSNTTYIITTNEPADGTIEASADTRVVGQYRVRVYVNDTTLTDQPSQHATFGGE